MSNLLGHVPKSKKEALARLAVVEPLKRFFFLRREATRDEAPTNIEQTDGLNQNIKNEHGCQRCKTKGKTMDDRGRVEIKI